MLFITSKQVVCSCVVTKRHEQTSMWALPQLNQQHFDSGFARPAPCDPFCKAPPLSRLTDDGCAISDGICTRQWSHSGHSRYAREPLDSRNNSASPVGIVTTGTCIWARWQMETNETSEARPKQKLIMFSESRSVTPADNKDSVNLYPESMAEVALGTPMVFDRYWSQTQKIQEALRQIFSIGRQPAFPNFQNALSRHNWEN